jgi:hypothetical protein
MEIGGFENFNSFTHESFELKYLWKSLREEREKLLQKLPQLRFHLENATIFMLRLIVGPEQKGLTQLLAIGEVSHCSEFFMSHQELLDILKTAVDNMLVKQDRYPAEVKIIMATHLQCSVEEINLAKTTTSTFYTYSSGT